MDETKTNEPVAPEKTSRWTDEAREQASKVEEAAQNAVVGEAMQAEAEKSTPPPWFRSFARGSMVQHNGWWAEITGYGQNEAGDIGVFMVPKGPTTAALKRGQVKSLRPRR